MESGNITLKYFEKRLTPDDDRFNVVIGCHRIVSAFVTKVFGTQSVTWIKCVLYIKYGGCNNSFQHDCNGSPHCTPYCGPSVLPFLTKLNRNMKNDDSLYFCMYFVFFFFKHPYHHFDSVLNLQIHLNHSDQERLHLQKTWFFQALYVIP